MLPKLRTRDRKSSVLARVRSPESHAFRRGQRNALAAGALRLCDGLALCFPVRRGSQTYPQASTLTFQQFPHVPAVFRLLLAHNAS